MTKRRGSFWRSWRRSLALAGLVGCLLPGLGAKVSRFQFLEVLDEVGRGIDSAWCFYQDEAGYMYIGTQSGLYVYNGYEYFVYKRVPGVRGSLSGNWINCIFEDSARRLWVGTKSGLNEFHRDSGTFTAYRSDPEDAGSLRMDYVKAIGEGRDGGLWVGTRRGICHFDPESGRFRSFDHQPGEMDAGRNQLECLLVDRLGLVWFGTEENGLFSFDPDTGRFDHYLHDADVEGSISSNNVTALVEDGAGRLWAAAERLESSDESVGADGATFGHGGLNRFDREAMRFVRVPVFKGGAGGAREEELTTMLSDRTGRLWVGTLSGDLYRFDPQSLEMDFVPDDDPAITRVTSIFLDRSGVLWVGRQFGAVLKTNTRSESFRSWSRRTGSGLSDDHVVAIYEDRSGALWVGTLGGGLNRFDPATGRFVSYEEGVLPDNRVSVVYEDRLGNFWVGVFGVSLCLFDRDEERVTREFRFDPEDERSLSDVRVRAILEDSRGRLWIGTRTGLNLYDRETQSFTRFVHDPQDEASLCGNQVKCLMEDGRGNLWVGTDDGVSVMNADGVFVRRFAHDPQNVNTISSNLVRCLYQESEDVVWIGTRLGLNRLSVADGVVSRYYEKDGLGSDVVFGLLEDGRGGIWVSTTRGVSRFDPASKRFNNIDHDAGLLNRGFELNAYFKSDSGRMYFGGADGLDSFHPRDVSLGSSPPALAITSMRKFDNPFLDWRALQGRDLVEFPSSDNFISFEFAVLDYVNPLRNRYRYRLEGFDQDWVASGMRRYASYTNLPPGEYRFRVQGANSRGHWNEKGVMLGLVVQPMYWQTLWFRLGVIAMVIGGGVALYILRVRGIEKYQTELELKVAERTEKLEEAKSKIQSQNEELTDHRANLERLVWERTSELELQKRKAEESDRLKSAFLENMSHEIRTPMNAIMGFLEIIRLEEHSKEENEEFFSIIKNAGDTLLSLINDILDLSAIDAGNINLEIKECDLHELLWRVFSSHRMLIESRWGGAVETLLEFGGEPASVSKEEQVLIKTDALRLEQVLSNLMSNAAKFTERGSIKLGYELDAERICIYVEDTGIGIASEDCAKVFERFGKLNKTQDEKLYRGVGLGLTICKKLVAVLGGEIRLDSEVGKGSRFQVFFAASSVTIRRVPLKAARRVEGVSPGRMAERTVLVAEDEDANYLYIEQVFKHDQLELVRARNGREVLELLDSGRRIDIVLMDIKMPVCDGHEATRVLKERYPDIPIIAQTAFASEKDRETCFRDGANGFIAKPYAPNELREAISEWL